MNGVAVTEVETHTEHIVTVRLEGAPLVGFGFSGDQLYPATLTLEYHERDGNGWKTGRVKVRGSKPKRDGTPSKREQVNWWYSHDANMPDWVRDLVETHAPR